MQKLLTKPVWVIAQSTSCFHRPQPKNTSYCYLAVIMARSSPRGYLGERKRVTDKAKGERWHKRDLEFGRLGLI